MVLVLVVLVLVVVATALGTVPGLALVVAEGFVVTLTDVRRDIGFGAVGGGPVTLARPSGFSSFGCGMTGSPMPSEPVNRCALNPLTADCTTYTRASARPVRPPAATWTAVSRRRCPISQSSNG